MDRPTTWNSWITSRESSRPCGAGTFTRGEENGAAYEEAQVCRFSRRGGVALSPDIAIPVSVLFGGESRLARMADFLGAETGRHLAGWRDLARTTGVRQCLPYVENHRAQLARIQIRAGASGGQVTLLALPTAAMAMSDDFAENVTVPQAIGQARKESPAKEALLRAVEAYSRDRASLPATILSASSASSPSAEQEAAEAEDDRQWRRGCGVSSIRKPAGRWRRRRRSSSRWESSSSPRRTGRPMDRVRCNERQHTLSSKLLKDGQVYATYLYEWIRTLGQDAAGRSPAAEGPAVGALHEEDGRGGGIIRAYQPGRRGPGGNGPRRSPASVPVRGGSGAAILRQRLLEE